MSVCTNWQCISAKELPLTELPDERTDVHSACTETVISFDMKGVVEEFFDQIGMHKKTEYDPKAGKTSSIRSSGPDQLRRRSDGLLKRSGILQWQMYLCVSEHAMGVVSSGYPNRQNMHPSTAKTKESQIPLQ